ncbi:hypothetical protein, partial [Serratia marcescens]|uniref:hypothetical protein n=1 Tax=Serratia marcescens TaxID=615 RepID=UPI001C37799C
YRASATYVDQFADDTIGVALSASYLNEPYQIQEGNAWGYAQTTVGGQPVDVIGGEQLTHAGYTETSRLLNQLVPSFNFPQPSLTDGTDSLRPATLRGLAPDQTLVPVN